ncbi:MAG: aspartate/glutamate racemase family protein [Rickettsiales bacterium]
MKTIGLIGGMSWESTAIYYRLINEEIKLRLGGLHSAQLLLWSFDFDEIASLQSVGDWDGATKRMVEAAINLKNGGAETLVICTNTMHKMAAEVERSSGLPVLHIADATARAIKLKQIDKVGLLATNFTMEQDFYKGRLNEYHNISTIIPDKNGRAIVHNVIYDELCKGITRDASKEKFLNIIKQIVKNGAQGILLGCTEIGMLVKQEDVSVPVFDTTILHANYAVQFALND